MERVKLAKIVPSPNPAGRHRFNKDNQPKNKGRKPGQPNRITTVLKDAIIMAAENTGDRRIKGKDKGGLVGYLEWLATKEPKSFASLLGRVLPYHLVGKVQHDHKVFTSKDEVIEELKRRGIPVTSVYGDDAKMIDVTPERVRVESA